MRQAHRTSLQTYLSLAAVLAGLWCLTGCQSNLTASDQLARAQMAMDEGDYRDALSALDDAIAKNPELGLLYLTRGQVQRIRGDFDAAVVDFTNAARLEPQSFSAHFNLALMLQELQRFAQAIKAYQKALEIRPLDPDANMNLAIAYVQDDQPGKALEYAKRAVAADSKNAAIQANYGTILAQVGQSDAAMQHLKRSLELTNNQPEVYLNLAGEHLRLKNFEQARMVLETASLICPNAAIWERLGFAYFKLNRWDDAKQAYRRALECDTRYYPAHNGLGVVLLTEQIKGGRAALQDEALTHWQLSLDIEPAQPAIKNLLARYPQGAVVPVSIPVTTTAPGDKTTAPQ